MASNEGMVAVVRGLGESGIAVTLMDGNKQYTLVPNDLAQGNPAPRNPPAPNGPQQRQNQHFYNQTYSPAPSDRHHQNHCIHNHHQEFDNQNVKSQRNQIIPNLRLEKIPNYPSCPNPNHQHQEPLYPSHLNHVGSSTERCDVRRESGIQVCDGRYASTYQTNHCYVEPTSPDYHVTEFPPQRPNPYPGHGNFVVGDPGNGESNQLATRSSSFRGAMSWTDRGAVCSPRPSRHPDAFASSLRKYPCTNISPDRSAEIVERLISYTQAKHFGISQNQSRTSTSSSRANHIDTALNMRTTTPNRLNQFATKRPINTFHDERPTHDGRADDIGVFAKNKDIRFTRNDNKRAQSSDNLTYSKNTISTETQAAPIKVSQEVETAVIIPPDTRTIAIQITQVQSKTKNKHLKEKFTLKAVQTTVSLIDIKEKLMSGQHIPKILFRSSKSDHVIITQSAEKLRLEILEWIRGVSLKPSKDKNERKQRRQLLRILTNKLNKLYAKNKMVPNIQEKDPGYVIEKSSKPMNCQLCNYVNGTMPMNMNCGFNDSTEIYFKENQIFYQIMDCGVRKEFENVISIWLDNIIDPSVQNKQTILNTFINKIKTIIANRPIHDREYKSILKGIIMDLIESIPIWFDGSCNKTVYKHRIADRLIGQIIELPGDVVYHTIHNLIQPTERELQRFVRTEIFSLLEDYKIQYLHLDCVERIRRDLTDILLDSMEVIRFGNSSDVISEISYWLEVSFGIYPRDAEKTARTIIENLKVYLNNKIDNREMLDDTEICLQPNIQNPPGSYLVYTSKSQEKVGKSRKSISMVMKKNNVTDTSMPGVSGQDVKGLSDNYLKLISQQIEEWLDNLHMQLPEAKDKTFLKTAVNDLASDIIDRQKYLELNPGIKPKEAEELEHLKYQIFKWIDKSVGENNKNTVSHAPDLMKRIKRIPIPMLTLPRQSINEPPKPEPTGNAGPSDAQKNVVDEVNNKIITMLRETPDENYSNPKDLYKTVREFSESLDSKIKSTSKNQIDVIHKQVPNFCKKALKIKNSTLIDNFKQEIDNIYLNKATPTDNDKKEKIVTQNLEDIIDSWIDTFPDEAAIVKDRCKLVHSFASRLSGIHKAMSNSAWYETKMREEINTWISNLSNQPPDKKAFREKYTNDLVQIILDTSLDSKSKEDLHKQGTEHLNESPIEDVVLEWLKSTPIYRLQNAEGQKIQEMIMGDLTKVINNLKQDSESKDIEEETIHEISRHIKKLPSYKGKQVCCCNTNVIIEAARQIYNLIENKLSKQDLSKNKDESNEFLTSIVNLWINQLPLNRTDDLEEFQPQIRNFIEDITLARSQNLEESEIKTKIENFLSSMPMDCEENYDTEANKLIMYLRIVPIGILPRKHESIPSARLSSNHRRSSQGLSSRSTHRLSNPSGSKQRLQKGLDAKRKLSFSQDTEDCSCQDTERLDAKKKLSFGQDTEDCCKNPLTNQDRKTSSIPCQTVSSFIERRASADQIFVPSSSEDESRNRRKSCPGAVSPLEPKCSQKNDSTQVQKGLEIYLREWVEEIPIDAKTPEEKEIASKARTGIYHGIGIKIIEIRSDREAFWNQFLCEDILDDEIDSLLDCLPQTPLMKSKRHALKVQLIQRVTDENDEIKQMLLSQSYRQQLKDTLSETLPSIKLDTADKEALEELAKDDLVDNFIQENYKGNDAIQKLVYKDNIFKEIKNIVELYSKNNKGKPINVEQLQKEIYHAMQKVPIPAEEALEEQIKEIIMKKEISQWYDDLPVKPTHDPEEELERKKLKSFLAKKILEIEKQTDQSNSIDGLIKHEISKWLEKSPLKKDADLKINDMVENLTNRMNNNPKLGGDRRGSFLKSSCQNTNDRRKSLPQDIPSYSTFAGDKPLSSSLTSHKTIEGRKHIAEDLSGHNTFSRNMTADSSIAHHKSIKGRTSIHQEPGNNTFANDVAPSTSITSKRKSIPRAQQTTNDDTPLASIFEPSNVSDYQQDASAKTIKYDTLETSGFDPSSVSALQPEANSKSNGSLAHIGPYDDFRSQPPLTSTPMKARRKSHQTSRHTITSPTFPRSDDSDIDGSVFRSVSEKQSRGILGTSQVPGPSCCARETSDRNKKSSEILYEAITNWCNRIPFPPPCSCVDRDNIKATKLNLSSKLIFKLGEVLANPEIFNDKFLFENYIESEIDQTLDSVPENEELNSQREKIKHELINQLEAVRHLAKKEQDGHNYRKSILDTIQKVVPKSCTEKNPDNMRDKIADSIIEMKFAAPENNKKSKKYLMDEIGRLVAVSKCCGKRLPPRQLKEKLYNSVARIPTPNKDNLIDELGEIRIKKELTKWFKKLPLKLEDDEQKQRVHKVTTILAKKIHEIEKQLTPDKKEYQEKMSNEILKWVGKLPLKPKQETKVQKSIKDFVTKLQKSYQYRQDIDQSYELNNDDSVDMALQSDQDYADESDGENLFRKGAKGRCGCNELWRNNMKSKGMDCYLPIPPCFWYAQPPGPYPSCYGHPYMPPCYR